LTAPCIYRVHDPFVGTWKTSDLGRDPLSARVEAAGPTFARQLVPADRRLTII